MGLVLKRIGSLEELGATLEVAGQQFDPVIAVDDRRLVEVIECFPDSAPLMVGVWRGDQPVAGACGRHTKAGFGLRIIGVVPELRMIGLGRRMLEVIELEAMAMGATSISLGAEYEARGFYEALGYRGKRSGKSKSFPPPGKIRDYRLAQLRAAAGDVVTGVVLDCDPATGKVPPLGSA